MPPFYSPAKSRGYGEMVYRAGRLLRLSRQNTRRGQVPEVEAARLRARAAFLLRRLLALESQEGSIRA